MAKYRKGRKAKGRGKGGDRGSRGDSDEGGGGGGMMMRMRGGIQSAAGTGADAGKPRSKLYDALSWVVTIALGAVAIYFLLHRLGFVGDDHDRPPPRSAVTGVVGPTAAPASATPAPAPVAIPEAPAGAVTAVPGMPPAGSTAPATGTPTSSP